MAYFLTETASSKGDLTAKNRVWGFFGEPTKSRLKNRPQSLQPRRENRPCRYKTASGIPYWPSRDPIEEVGGINLYAFVGNDGIGNHDRLGLVINNVSDAISHFRSGKGGSVAAGSGLIKDIKNSQDYLDVITELYGIIFDKLEKADHSKTSGTIKGSGHRGLSIFVLGSYKLDIKYSDPWSASPWKKLGYFDSLFTCGQLGKCHSRQVKATVIIDFSFKNAWDFHPHSGYGAWGNFWKETVPGAIVAAGTSKAKDFWIYGSWTHEMKLNVTQCK